jgi:hypothetical protein
MLSLRQATLGAKRPRGHACQVPGMRRDAGIPALDQAAVDDGFDAGVFAAESQKADRTSPPGQSTVQDPTTAALLRSLVNELRDAHSQLAVIAKYSKRTGQWVTFWSIIMLLPFFFWCFVLLASMARFGR